VAVFEIGVADSDRLAIALFGFAKISFRRRHAPHVIEAAENVLVMGNVETLSNFEPQRDITAGGRQIL